MKAGARDERPEENGIAHFLEHMAFKGTKKRSARDIAEEIESAGGEINASTGMETTTYYARVLKDDWALALDILADIFTESVLDAEEMERERDVILQEISAANDQPDDLVFDLAQTASYGDIARRVGAPGAARVVGQAMASNPVPLIIPCHRILGGGNRMGGFSAPGGTATKARLLALEGVQVGAPRLPGL